ncbi:MAG: glycosyltransferase [Elusimicrobiota bacterium]
MDIVLTLFFVISGNIIQIYFFVTMFLYLFISFTGIVFYKKNSVFLPETNKKFAILIPAHNEENVIANLLESINLLDYPKSLYDVYVICDHCQDKTKEIAEKYSPKIIEYNDSFPSSKAKALNKATQEILDGEVKYDAFCYFDADSLIHPDFLKAMSFYLSNGFLAIQGQQLPKNPRESLISIIISSGQFITNNFFQKPKNLLGFSATLHGKGMCFDIELVRKFKWDENCLTEDLEMQMRLVAGGVRILWGEHAIVYDEEPVLMRQYFVRSIRWTRGSLDTAKKHAKNLFFIFLKTFDFRVLEAFIYCFGVYRVLLLSFGGLAMYVTRDRFNLLVYLFHLIPYDSFIAKLIFILGPFIIFPFLILFDKKIGVDMFFGYFLQPALGFFRIPIFLLGVVKNKEEWDRTEHTSSVKINDILGNNRRLL